MQKTQTMKTETQKEMKMMNKILETTVKISGLVAGIIFLFVLISPVIEKIRPSWFKKNEEKV